MDLVKKILAWLVIVFAVIGIIVCIAGVILTWAYNPTARRVVVDGLGAMEQALAAGDQGLARVEARLGEAQSAVDTVEATAVDVGDQLSSTSIAFQIIERTVGDTLFPVIESIRETIQTINATVVAFNAALEAANQIPFVEVPTLTADLEAVSADVDAARENAAAARDELQEMREEAIDKPVTAITDKTSTISDGLGRGQDRIGEARSSLSETRTHLQILTINLTRLINLASIAITILLLWLGLANASLLTHAAGYLRGYDPLDPIRTS